MLLAIEDEHAFHNYVSKGMKINDPDGSRRTNPQVYSDLPLEDLVELMYNLICEVEADVVVDHGWPARRALKKRLGLGKDRPGAGQNYEIMDVVISGKMRALTFLPHGKFNGCWANVRMGERI